MAKQQVKKNEKKKIAKNEKQRKEKLYGFLKDYGDVEDSQDARMASTDRQIQSIMAVLSDHISATPKGTVVDIGCGKGIMLGRLSNLQIFREKDAWAYLGTDFPERSNEVLQFAIEAGVHRKTDFVNLDDFNTNWPNRNKFIAPHAVVIRNVFHELDIEETARLVMHVSNNLDLNELVIIQDLAVFPKAEKGHACWIPDHLSSLFSICGFSVSTTSERSPSGNRWFNIICRKNKKIQIKKEEIKNEVRRLRCEQIDKWKSQGALTPDDELFRDVQIAKIDFDLQFASIVFQLQKIGITTERLTATQESLIHRSTFIKHLSDFGLYIPKRKGLAITSSSHFRDRMNSLNALVEFFTSKYTITLISGPPLMGKSELVRHFLCSEYFSQDRLAIFVDIYTTSDVWNILDQIFSEMGCAIPNDVLLSMANVKLSDIYKVLQDFFLRHSSQIVIVVDHLERITEPSGVIVDTEIKELFQMIAEGASAKLILTSRKHDTDLSFLTHGLIHPGSQPVVGRFPRQGHEHVEHVLQSFMLVAEYPNELLKAIDYHPFLATLAGMYLQQKGSSAFADKDFLEDLRFKLRDAIFAKILTSESRSAVEAISRLRIPVPRDMVVKLSSFDSVKAAEDSGLIRQHLGGIRDDLVGCIGALRITTWEFSLDEVILEKPDDHLLPSKEEKQINERIANLYEQIYRISEDPVWLREAHFHRMIYSSREELEIFGQRFRTEFYAAGEYWYDHDKDFEGALWAYNKALKYGQAGYRIRMRIASCALRIASNNEQENNARKQFEDLIRSFPEEFGIKTAYIDAVLFRKDYQETINLLKKLNLKMTDSWWIAGQYGRAYSGLHEHRKAIDAFELQLQAKPEAMAYEQISRAYHRLGDTENEFQKINQGILKHQSSRRLLVYKGAILERIGQTNDAVKLLNELLSEDPDNGWVFFPYLRAMDRLGKLSEAVKYWKEHRQKIRPEFLRISIESYILIKQGRHSDAITKLKSLNDDEHKLGQLLDAYLSWAENQRDEDEGRRIAAEGISIPLDPIILRNVPVLTTRLKLAIFAKDKNTCKDTIYKIKSINPLVTELEQLQNEYEKLERSGGIL